MIREKIIEDLKNEIARGKFKPGQRLVEMTLCERYGMGRTKIRHALVRLESDGFVKIVPNSGAIVVELSQKDIEHIYDLMGVLEGLAMRVATPLISKKKIEEIERLIEKMEGTDEIMKFFKYNYKFHSYLDYLSENDRLISFNKNLRGQATRASIRSFYNPNQLEYSIFEHRKILGAIKEKNSLKVEKAIRKHYLQSKIRLIKYLNKSL